MKREGWLQVWQIKCGDLSIGVGKEGGRGDDGPRTLDGGGRKHSFAQPPPHPNPLTLEDTLPKYGVEEDEIASKFVKHGTILHLEHCK